MKKNKVKLTMEEHGRRIYEDLRETMSDEEIKSMMAEIPRHTREIHEALNDLEQTTRLVEDNYHLIAHLVPYPNEYSRKIARKYNGNLK